MAAAPTMKKAAVRGISRSKPPARSISRLPVAWMTAPAQKNRSALKVA